MLNLLQVPFDSTKHIIVYNSNGLVSLIDEMPVFGTDAMIPLNKLESAYLVIDLDTLFLTTEGMYDPGLDVCKREFFAIVRTYLGFKIRAVLSSGAGVYGVEWAIIGNKSFRTIITNDWRIIDKDFLKQKDHFDDEPKD